MSYLAISDIPFVAFPQIMHFNSYSSPPKRSITESYLELRSFTIVSAPITIGPALAGTMAMNIINFLCCFLFEVNRQQYNAQTVRDSSSCYKVMKNFLKLEGHQNRISGSKVTVILLKGEFAY